MFEIMIESYSFFVFFFGGGGGFESFLLFVNTEITNNGERLTEKKMKEKRSSFG